MIKYDSSHDKFDCCGCKACEQACPKQAIVMEADAEGFLYPVINADKCINCGQCNKVCPIEAGDNSTMHPLEVLAAQCKDDGILAESSSGGIFSLIAGYVIDNGGVVYGAAFDEDMYLRHIRVSDKEGLAALRGSKYVQSDIGDAFTQVRDDLKNGVLVYFTGTPCQIQGLKLFLRKEYEGLVTTDLVCHGTPSYKIFVNTLRHIEEKKRGKIFRYLFRDKQVGGWSCSSSSSSYRRLKDNRVVSLPRDNDMSAYYNAFIGGNMMRYVCYKCPFANIHRPGDITLADCWGVDKFASGFPDIRKGVSTVMINTEKGRTVWDAISVEAVSMPISEADAVANNANLHRPSPLPEGRSGCYSLAYNDYDSFLNLYQPSLAENIKFYVKYNLKRIPFIGRALRKIKTVLK